MNDPLTLQQTLFHTVSRALDNFKKIGRNNYTPAKIRSRMTFLKETWAQCRQNHALILQLYPEGKREKMDYFEDQKMNFHEDLYQTAMDHMAESLEEVEPIVSPNQSLNCTAVHTEASSLSLQHLPAIKLPPFSGRFEEWESFRDRFTSLIIQNKELSDFTRMHYLASSVTGQVRDAIARLAVTADNFEPAWKTLNARFEHKRRLIEVHVSTLLNLPSMSRESAAELHALRDKVDQAISSLERLKRSPEDMLHDIIVYCVFQKLDAATRRAWKLKFSDKSTPATYDDLSEFLSSRATSLEELKPVKASKSTQDLKVTSATASAVPEPNCVLCQKRHFLNKCPKFAEKSPSQRREFVKQQERCFNCLSTKHAVLECKSRFTCRKCQKKHHSMLHVDSPPSLTTNLATVPSEQPDESTEKSQINVLSAISIDALPSPVLLATARVVVSSPAGRTQTVRALLDQGSEVSFITENLAQILRLPRLRTMTSIAAVGCVKAGTCKHAAQIQIASRDKSGPTFNTVAFIMTSLTKYSPRRAQFSDALPHLQHLKLADDDPTGSDPIDIIIGADLYGRIIVDGVTKREELRRFWEAEELPAQNMLSPDERLCEEHFCATHTRDPHGRYIVRLPFKKGPPVKIGESLNTASRMLVSLNRRLNRDPELRQEYETFLSEYEQLGHMEKALVDSESASSQKVYIPHHAVVRNSSATTRVRVVFNASSLTTNGTSLNSHLLPGSKFQTELFDVLLRWRQHRYVYTADIAKMYRQILIDPRDRDYQRILWNADASPTPQEYRLRTVTYGTTSAPFLALRVIKQLIHDEGESFPLASLILRDNIYVDDVLFGAEDVPLLIHERDQVCALLQRGGFKLRKWASNKSELLKDIPAEDYGLACNKNLNPEDNLSVLGIGWNPAGDVFQFRVSLPKALPSSKRAILSTIAKLFDPLGWVTPVTIAAKIFMQQLWSLKLEWDDDIPKHHLTRWEAIYRRLAAIDGLKLERWVKYGSDTAHCELHGFADASSVAYAAVVYLRVTSISGEVTTTMLAGKSKVAPIRPMTIPRLELSAAVLLSRLMESIQSALQFTGLPCHCWTDSTVTLAWISQHPSKWKTFVAHRVAVVQTKVPDAQWHHVPSADNPADCASRGLLDQDLGSCTLWWQGPQWLRLAPCEWPRAVESPPVETELEKSSAAAHFAQVDNWDLAQKYSDWPKLLRVTAYILRFITRCRKPQKCLNSSGPEAQICLRALTAAECEQAKQFWLKAIQREVFSKELTALQQHRSLSPRSTILAFNPFLDNNNLIRVGGRLKNAPLPFRSKHPILLASHPLVKVIIRHAHQRSLHAGIQLTLSTLRQEFWLLRARNLVKSVIHQCVTCTREKAVVPVQLMGQLPRARVSAPARAFLHCGVDFAGPVATRPSSGRGITTRKTYIAVFICLATRAVHLELVGGYSTPAFLDAYTRFCARRGLPTDMYSDNGTNFTGAEKELMKAYREAVQDPDFLNRAAVDKVSWHFIPPHAPHFGGLWEAGVRSLKYHLKRIIGLHTLTFEELTTVLCKIEACLNSRPLEPLTASLDDYEPLTPGHFLIGSALTTTPEPSVLHVKENRLSRWQLVRQLTERFWKVWQTDYINTLQQRAKWRKAQPSVQIGTMVLLRNATLPPCKWELGRVIQLFAGSDGLVRVVLVKTANSEYKRPLSQLCILPIESASQSENALDKKL